MPLLCDTDIARISNPGTPLPAPAFRHPEDAREQLVRARKYHERVFGKLPEGLWPSEGSVSEQALGIAAELGFKWFATDEGVLGRTLSAGFGRDAAGVPDNADKLYSPLRVRAGGREMVGFFRDHYLSDLVGFVYSRMDAGAAAEDLYQRIRAIGERVSIGRPLTVSLILDGENAWEYFPGNGREFLRQFYRRIDNDPDITALTASEAAAAAGDIPRNNGIFPASWISANFDVWIGSGEDVTAWEHLNRARDFYQQQADNAAKGFPKAPTAKQLAASYEVGAGGRGQRLVLVVRAGTQFGERRGVRRVLQEAIDRSVRVAGRGSAGCAGGADQAAAGARADPAALGEAEGEGRRARNDVFRVDGRGAVFAPTAAAARCTGG